MSDNGIQDCDISRWDLANESISSLSIAQLSSICEGYFSRW